MTPDRDDRAAPPVATHYARRCAGLAIGLSPVVLLVASAVFALMRGSRGHPIGLAVTALATTVGAMNAYLSFVRPTLYERANGSRTGYRHVSIVPVIGTVLLVMGTLIGFGSLPCAGLGLVCAALDTGGSPWFLWATWGDHWFWDGRR